MDPAKTRVADELHRQFPSVSLAEAYTVAERHRFNLDAAAAELRSTFSATAGDHGVLYEPAPPRTGGVGEVMEQLFRQGGHPSGGGSAPEAQAFFGSGRRLGHTEMPSPVIPASMRQQRSLEIAVYANVIHVGLTGEAPILSIPMNTPEAEAFMNDVKAGVLPGGLEERFPGSDFDVQLKDYMHRRYEPPAKSFEAFQAEGNRLGASPTPGAAAAGVSYDPGRTFSLDDAAEKTVVRLIDTKGKQTEQHVNPSTHTVEDLYLLAHRLEPERAAFILEVRDMPPRKLGPETRAQTIAEARLKRAVIVMRPM